MKLLEISRCLLVQSGLCEFLYAKAVNRAVYLLNRSPTSAVNCMTTIEAWTCKKPCINHLKVFGSIAGVLKSTWAEGETSDV